MNSATRTSQMDQCSAHMNTNVAPMIASYREALVGVGLTERQAFTLARDFHRTICQKALEKSK